VTKIASVYIYEVGMGLESKFREVEVGGEETS
jgi:hypothetical protein